MAWIYLAESEESQRPWLGSPDQSPIVRETDSVNPCFCHGCGKEFSQSLQFGMTCKHLGAGPYLIASILFMGDSHARTSALQEAEGAWMESDLDSFERSCDSLASYDPGSSSWKTSQLSLLGGLTEFSWESLRWGTIVDGRLFQPKRWEPRTCESAGSYLPTPTATPGGYNQTDSPGAAIRPSLEMMARKHLWPTPTVHGNYNRPQTGTSSGTGLATAVKQWPTPNARDGKGAPGKGCQERGGHQSSLPAEVGGPLNPTWVEWLMGYPLGWTVLEDWAMQWYRPKWKKQSGGSVDCEQSPRRSAMTLGIKK